MKEKILDLYRWLNGSAYQSVLTQYFDFNGAVSSSVAFAGSYTDTRTSVPPAINNNSIKEEVEYSISHQQGWGPPTYENQYVVLFPPGTEASESWKGACAAHGWSGSFSWSGIPWSPEECQRGLDIGSAMQVSASHEYAESVTDPIIASGFRGWENETVGGEISDICNTGTPEEQAEAAPGIFVAKVTDNYLWAAKGRENRCVAQDVAPARFEVTTSGAVVTSPHHARLVGSVNPAGWSGNFNFAFSGPGGTHYFPSPRTENPGTWYGFTPLTTGFSPEETSAEVTDLKGNTTYQMRLDGNGALTLPVEVELAGFPFNVPGSTLQFTTPDWRPGVSVQPVSNRSQTGATLNAAINPQGEPTTYRFEWGTTPSYGNASEGSVGSGVSSVVISQPLSGLKPETTIHFRVVATNGEGVTASSDRSFTTLAQPVTFATAMGGLGTGPGQFNHPAGMAGDADGNIWVVDMGNSRLEKFSAKGDFLTQFGSKGSASGQLNEPQAAAIDGEGNIWVADTGNDRIEEFSPGGQILLEISENLHRPTGIAIGREGHVFVSDQNAGVISAGAIREYRRTKGVVGSYEIGSYSFLQAPVNMASDAQGDVWFADAALNGVYEISASGGGPARRFGVLGVPYAVAVKPSGSVFVTEQNSDRVQQYNPEGELLASFGGSGGGAGQVKEPTGLSLSSRGVIFLADGGNNRIERWTQVAAPEAVTEPPVEVGETVATLKGRIDPEGGETHYWFEYGKSAAYGSLTSEVALGGGFEASQVKAQLTGLAFETTYHFRVVASNSEGTTQGPDETFTTSTPTYGFSFGTSGGGAGQFNRPVGLATDSAGNVWAVDRGNSRLEKFNANGEFQMQFGSKGSANGQMNEPRAIAIDGEGNLWVADAGNARIEEFSPAGQFLMKINQSLHVPSGIAIGREGHIFVSDPTEGVLGTACVREYRKNGGILNQYQLNSWCSGFSAPANMTSDSRGDVWLVDSKEHKVYEISAGGGGPVARFEVPAAGGLLPAPYAIAVKPSGNLLVTDQHNNRVDQFSTSGQLQLLFGSGGTGPGQFSEPSGIAVTGGNAFVADAANNRVQKWEFK